MIHGTRPSSNAEWWRSKLDVNVRRDRPNDRDLAAAGWTVLRIWVHETDVTAADCIEAAARSPGFERTERS